MAKDMEEDFGTEKDAAYDKLRSKADKSEKAKGVLRGAGYARGGGVSPVKAVHKHESHLHKGKKKTEFKHGGKIEGKKTAMRADKFKRGGSVAKGHHTRININVGAAQAEKQQAMKAGVMVGAKLAAAKMAGGARPGAGAPMQARPMPGGPAPGGMPPGGAPPTGTPPMVGAARGGCMYKSGGKVGPVKVAGVPHLKGGGGGAKGRMSKIASYGTKPKA